MYILPNDSTPSSFKQMLMGLKRNINSNIIIVEILNIPLSSIGRSLRQKVNKEVTQIIYTTDQMHLFNIYRTFHYKNAESMFFSSVHTTFSRIQRMLGHTANFRNFKDLK